MTIKQKRAISYAIADRARRRREAFLIEKEGGLSGFRKSGYKSLFWYIRARYGVRIY
jgi:hypothetical protein